MAKYNKSKLYFYKLPDSFFERDEIEWFKIQDNGHKKIVVYLELIFRTINKNGILGRMIGDNILPYSISDLSRLVNEDEELVEEALNDFIDIGFIIKIIYFCAVTKINRLIISCRKVVEENLSRGQRWQVLR